LSENDLQVIFLLEQLATASRLRLEQSRLDQLDKIETNRKASLEKLNIKYAMADKVKTSFGYIGITFLSVLWGAIILNDLAKLFNLFYEETKDLLKVSRTKKEIRRREELEQDERDIEKNEMHFQELEEKLEKIHLQLVTACAARTSNANIQK
jgi:hypothetical protein